MVPLDIWGPIGTAILAVILVASVLGALFGYLLYRAFRKLPSRTQEGIAIVLVLAGAVLIFTLIGIEVGTVVFLTGIFMEVFRGTKGGAKVL